MSDVRVIAGSPTADELAMVVALLTAPAPADAEPRMSLWSAPQLRPSELPRSWWASGLPR